MADERRPWLVYARESMLYGTSSMVRSAGRVLLLTVIARLCVVYYMGLLVNRGELACKSEDRA